MNQLDERPKRQVGPLVASTFTLTSEEMQNFANWDAPDKAKQKLVVASISVKNHGMVTPIASFVGAWFPHSLIICENR